MSLKMSLFICNKLIFLFFILFLFLRIFKHFLTVSLKKTKKIKFFLKKCNFFAPFFHLYSRGENYDKFISS